VSGGGRVQHDGGYRNSEVLLVVGMRSFRSLSCSHCWKSKSKAHGQHSNCNQVSYRAPDLPSTSTVVELDLGALHRYARVVTCRCGLVRIYGYCSV
jgi:hypothetical protein